MKFNCSTIILLLIVILLGARVTQADIGALITDVVHTVEDGVRVAASLGLDKEAVADFKKDAQGVVDNIETTFGPDGDVTKFTESLPVAGYIASVGHALAGDDQRAKRAAAVATDSTITTAAAAIGSVAAGPVGAMAGAAIGSTIGQLVEVGINYSIEDPELRTDKGTLEDLSIAQFGAEVGANVVGSALSSTVGTGVVNAATTRTGTGGISKWAAKRGASSLIGVAGTVAIEKAAEKL